MIGDDADGAASESSKADHDVFSVVGVNFDELVVIEDFFDDHSHIIGFLKILWNNGVEVVAKAIAGVISAFLGGVFDVVGGHKGEQLANLSECGLIVGYNEVSDAAFFVVDPWSAEVVVGDDFVGDGFGDVGAGDVHVGGIFDHDDKVGDGGGVDGSAGAGSHDGGYLGDESGGEGVSQEDICVSAEAFDSFLNAGSAGVVESNDRGSGFHGEVHNLANFAGIGT